MGEQTKIEWCEHTFNAWEGCTKVSAGCLNCYAEARDKRIHKGSHWGPGAPRKLMSEGYWRAPLAWDRAAKEAGERHRVFCSSLADVFDAEAPPGQLDRLWDLIYATPNLDWLLLTKRPERIAASLPEDWGAQGWPNVWLGTSVEHQGAALTRIPHLISVPAKVRFLSCEPLLGPLTLADPAEPLLWDQDGPHASDLLIHWVICGGESGHGARPMDLAWARDLRDQVVTAGSAFFFKQVGAVAATVSRKGGEIEDIPADLLVRQFQRPAKL